jgi:DNA excision repair protein ERCC-3
MPAKRKAADLGSARASKISTPNPPTPISNLSEEDGGNMSGSQKGSDQDFVSGSEQEHINRAKKKAAFSSYNTKTKTSRLRPSIFGNKDFSYLSLKPDHDNRPLWIDPSVSVGSKKGPKITLESFSTLAAQAEDFLITVAEPQSRPQYLHEYRLTEHSLYAALSVGLSGQDIVRTLEKLSKTPLPAAVSDFITKHTKSYGKVRLVLRDNRFFVESEDPAIIQILLTDSVIGACRKEGAEVVRGTLANKAVVISGTSDARGAKQTAEQQDQNIQSTGQLSQGRDPKEDEIMMALREEDEEEDPSKQTQSFEIGPNTREKVAERCLDVGYPALSEYDYQNDRVNPDLRIDLKPHTQIRSYQEKALSKMFGNGRAKSGIIVLPCGAGKTLVGITAGCTIRKGIIVLCTSAMSVFQWSNEFKKWSDVNSGDVAVFTSGEKEKFRGETGVIVSTYSMISQTRQRAHDSEEMMKWITSREWGLMILDEVHVVPAAIFRKVAENVRAHCKLGLTATLLREDDKITDLNYIIGPKLYEANWMELADQGHIAKVQCAEVWCPMTIEFYQEYQSLNPRKQALLYIMNPTKFQVCQFLIDYHEKRGDKIIVFSDNVFALKQYAEKLKKAYIYGGTGQQERIRILENFQHNDAVNTIFLSKIGDTSLDLPEATCLIQISSHYGSRRQEAQRLGRILRAKRRNDEGFNAFFYSLVSKDTSEMGYSAKRQAFLVDQGYAFKVITQLSGMDSLPGLAFRTREERLELLNHVLLKQESDADLANIEQIDEDLFSGRSGAHHASGGRRIAGGVRRQAGSLADLAGGGQMAYKEQNVSRNKQLKKEQQKGPQSDYFKKEARARDRRRKTRLKESQETSNTTDGF